MMENYRNISSNSIDILFNMRGVSKIALNNNIYNMNLYDVIVVNPYEPYEIFNQDSTLLQLRINRSLLNLSEDLLKLKFNCNSCDYKNKEKFHELFILIYSYIKDLNSKTYLENVSISYAFLDELVKSFTIASSVKTNDFTKLLNYIEINYDQNIMLKDLADTFHLTIPYLSKRFKEITGETFNEYYDKLRITHANYDLLETELPIIDISMKHGFASTQAYLRAYKKINGILPSEARKNKNNHIAVPDGKYTSIFNDVVKEFNERVLTIKPYNDIYITANYSQAPQLIQENVSNAMIGIGGAKILLYRNVQDVLTSLQKNNHYNYGHIRGLLSDDFSWISRLMNGKLEFKFNLINEVLDYMENINLHPAINLVFMSQELASDPNKIVFSEQYNVSLPRDLDEWKFALKSFMEHVVNRYGIEYVRKWMFIPWSQPDSSSKQFGFDNNEDFFNFYKVTYQTIKEVDSEIIVASPDLLPITEKNFTYFDNFLTYAKKNECFPDTLSILFYANNNIDSLTDIYLKGKHFYNIKDFGYTSNPNLMHEYLIKIKDYLNAKNYDLPIYLTGYNFTITQKSDLLDTLFNSNFVIKNYIDNMDLIKSYSYWHLTDFENTSISTTLFFGGSGMFLSNGIAKPIVGAYENLYKMLDEVLARGNNYVITRDSKNPKHILIILYNYEHPSQSDNLNLEPDDKYKFFINKERNKVHLTINSIPYTECYLREFSINRYHGNPYDRWILMGKPDTDVFHRGLDVVNNLLKAAENPDYKETTIHINNNIFSYEVNMDPLEVKSIDIFLK